MDALRALTPQSLALALPDENVRFAALTSLATWRVIRDQVAGLERWIGSHVDRSLLKALRSAPGIGPVLGATIVLETGPIARFQHVGNYASYCRLVSSERISNGKRKGQGNRKNGNRYLAWAFIEAANFALRHYQVVRDWYDRKRRSSHRLVALKAVAHKIARGCYFAQRDHVEFDIARAFG